MNYYLVSAFSFSIFIPAVIALFHFRRIEWSYYPFLFCLWLGAINELFSFFLIRNKTSTTVNNNIYVLVESMLLLWYFLFAETISRKWFIALATLYMTIWISENYFFGNIRINSTYFRIIASMTIAFLSIKQINIILTSYHPGIHQNADFVLCSCFLIYFTYKALIQAFILYGLTRDLEFLKKIYDPLIYINLGINLLYIPAVIWMPKKARFILPLS